MDIKTKKLPKVNPELLKYHKNIKNITTKQASLKIMVAILAKKFVLYFSIASIFSYPVSISSFFLDNYL